MLQGPDDGGVQAFGVGIGLVGSLAGALPVGVAVGVDARFAAVIALRSGFPVS